MARHTGCPSQPDSAPADGGCGGHPETLIQTNTIDANRAATEKIKVDNSKLVIWFLPQMYWTRYHNSLCSKYSQNFYQQPSDSSFIKKLSESPFEL
jgi:hypothetical protein